MMAKKDRLVSKTNKQISTVMLQKLKESNNIVARYWYKIQKIRILAQTSASATDLNLSKGEDLLIATK